MTKKIIVIFLIIALVITVAWLVWSAIFGEKKLDQGRPKTFSFTIIYDAHGPVTEPKTTHNFYGSWNTVNMVADQAKNQAWLLVENVRPGFYLFNIEYFPSRWAATTRLEGVVRAKGVILPYLTRNEIGSFNIQIRVNEDGSISPE